MEKVKGSCVNLKGWCWVNGICIIMFLRGHNIFFSYDCVEHLKRLAEIIGADIKKIESEDTLLPDKKT